MSVVGIVAEYNPFHNGHKYHLEQSKSLCGADISVCVMSGNFIQRGEPAIVDKWARTEMCLLEGIDLVIELPVVYAMASAEFFAYGAVRLLNSLGVADHICFGSEAGNVAELAAIAGILADEPEEYRSVLQDTLSQGLSFPAARETALRRYLEAARQETGNLSQLINNSNNILGIEYLKALKKLGSNIKPHTIKRMAASYNSPHLTGSISSATAIRKHIAESQDTKGVDVAGTLQQTLPEACRSILQREFDEGRGPVFPRAFEHVLLSSLRRMDTGTIAALPYVSEGLENRIKSAAESSGTLDELLDGINTRRYTNTRIQRCLFSILTGLTNEEFLEFNNNGGPQYIRVLGFNDKGRGLLSRINKTAGLPVIVKTADFKSSGNRLLSRMLETEAASTDQYVLSFRNPQYRKSGGEFTHSPVYIG